MKMTIVALAMLVLFFGCIDSVMEGTADTGANPLDVFNRSMNGYVSLIRSTDTYSATIYNEVNGKSSDIGVKRSGDDYEVVLGAEMYAWTLKNVGGTKYLCLLFDNRTECTSTLSGQGASVAKNLESALMSRQQADLMEMKYNGLLRHGSINVMSFSETAESYVFEINYSLKDLTGEELSRMFLSPTSPAMTVNSYRERITFRKSDSLRTRDELIYNLLGSDNDEISEISDFRYGSAEIKAPESVNESRFNMQMGTFSEFWTKYSEAKTDADFKQIAIGYKMPEFCKRTSNVLQCIDAYTAMTKDANGCGVLEGSQRDTCYYNFGTIDDKKHCESIADGTMRQDCLDKGKETEPGESGNTTIIRKAGNATEITNETVKDWIRYD